MPLSRPRGCNIKITYGKKNATQISPALGLCRGEESNLANVAEPSESLRGVCSIGSSLSDYDAISANPAVLTDRRGTNVIFETKNATHLTPCAGNLTKLITLKLFNYARLALWMARRSNLATQAREPHGGRALDTIKTLKNMEETLWVVGHRTPRRLPRRASQSRLCKHINYLIH